MLKSIGIHTCVPLYLELHFLKEKLNSITSYFSDIHQSVPNPYLLDSVVWYPQSSGKKKKNLPFSPCKEVLYKCFLAADDKSTACNTFLQLISGKKPDVTAIQFAKPIGVLRLFFFFFF